MFVKQAIHDAVIAEKKQLAEQNAELQKQIETITAEITAANQQKDTVAQENATLRSEAETSEKAIQGLVEERDDLALQVQQLTEENTKLRDLPGASSTVIKAGTEINHGEQKTELDKVNDFCRENADDVNACLAQIKKVL